MSTASPPIFVKKEADAAPDSVMSTDPEEIEIESLPVKYASISASTAVLKSVISEATCVCPSNDSAYEALPLLEVHLPSDSSQNSSAFGASPRSTSIPASTVGAPVALLFSNFIIFYL